MFEADFERLVVGASRELFPGFSCGPFKERIESPLGNCEPDGVMVDCNYGRWIILEVELASHSLSGHVVPQVEVFINGKYTQAHARAIAAELPELDPDRISDMVRFTPPQVLVVANEYSIEWAERLARLGAEYCSVEVYREPGLREALVLRGSVPTPATVGVCECEVDALLGRILRLKEPLALGELIQAPQVTILIDGGSTEWRVMRTADTVSLVAMKRNPLPNGTRSFLLERSEDGSLHLR